MRRRLFPIVGVALMVAAACVSSPVVGQGGHVWLEPHVGWLVPTRDLGRTDILGHTGFGIFERADQSAVLGLAGEVELSSRWALRASFDHVFDAAVQGEWRCVPFVACPDVLLPLEGELSHWTATVDGLYRPVTGFLVDPVLFAGLGLRRSALGWNQPPADIVLPAVAFDELSAFCRLGVGIERAFGRVKVFGEFAMMTSWFGGGRYESIEGSVEDDREVSLDLGLVSGVRVRLR